MLSPGDVLYAAIMERGRVPLVRGCFQLVGPTKRPGKARTHVTDRPSVTWCRACRRIVIRGKGRWWE